MKEPVFSPTDSLHLIEQMIHKAQGRFNENGHLYLLWGWVILLFSIASFISIQVMKSWAYINYIWLLTIPVFIYQMVYLARKKKVARVKTYTDEITNYVWLVFVVMGLLSAIIIFRSGQPQLFNPVMLILYAMPTFLSGVLLRFAPLRMGGVCCWVLALLATFIPSGYSFLLLALAVAAAWIIPGYLLRSRFQKQD